MKPVIFIVFPAHGHINPTLPVVSELIRRGRRVLYYGIEEARDKIEATGAEFRPYRSVRITPRIVRALQNPVWFVCLLIRWARVFSEQLRDEIRELDPQCIVYDSLWAAGKILAEDMSVKHVSSVTILLFTEQRIRMNKSALLLRLLINGHRLIGAAVNLLRIRRRTGRWLKPFDMLVNKAPLNIVYTSRYFQPDGESFDGSYTFVGPSIRPRNDAGNFPLQRLEVGKVIYISLGTILNDRPDFYRDCIGLLGRSGHTVVISIGSALSVESLGELPENVIVRNSVPQLEVLERADLFITHGGMNSVQEGLYYAVPLIVIPLTPEQIQNAVRVEELGAGKMLAKPADLMKSGGLIADILAGESSYGENARIVSESLKNGGGYQTAAEAILTYLRA